MQRLKKEITLIIAGLMLSIFFAVAAGAVPGLINYQGRLLAGGQAVTTDSQLPLPMTFRFYDASAAGSLLYEELQDVAVVDGIYSVQLGESPTENGSYGNLIDAVAEAAAGIWLEIEINGEVLLPRQKFTSTPYAIRAGEAEVAATVMENAIGSFAITNASVTGEKLADGAVTLAKFLLICVLKVKFWSKPLPAGPASPWRFPFASRVISSTAIPVPPKPWGLPPAAPGFATATKAAPVLANVLTRLFPRWKPATASTMTATVSLMIMFPMPVKAAVPDCPVFVMKGFGYAVTPGWCVSPLRCRQKFAMALTTIVTG